MALLRFRRRRLPGFDRSVAGTGFHIRPRQRRRRYTHSFSPSQWLGRCSHSIHQPSRNHCTRLARDLSRLGGLLIFKPDNVRTHLMRSTSFLAVILLLFCANNAQAAWWNKEWTIRKKIDIDTTTAGAPIADPIDTTAILIRLHDGNFRFTEAK